MLLRRLVMLRIWKIAQRRLVIGPDPSNLYTIGNSPRYVRYVQEQWCEFWWKGVNGSEDLGEHSMNSVMQCCVISTQH